MRKYLLLITGLISTTLIAQTQSISTEVQSQISTILEVDSRQELPGGAIVILQDGQPVYSKYFGLANLNDGTKINEETRFHLNFSTQTFIAQAIINFAETGRLSLQDSAEKYIPELPDIANSIRISHLLDHTSGLYDYWALKSLGGWDYDDVFKKDQAFQMLKKFESLNNPPGETYNFSNTNYLLLAEILRRVSETSLNEVLKKEFFDPLGMHSAFISENYAAPVQNKALYYFDYGDGHQTSYAKYGNDAGSVGLYATLNDIQKWMRFLETHENSNQLLPFTTIDYKGYKLQFQDAFYFGYRGFLGKFPDQELSIVLLSNDYYYNIHDRALEIASLFLPEQVEGRNEKDTFQSLSNPKEVVGHYWDRVDKHSKGIELRNDTLYYKAPRGWSSPLVMENGGFKILNSRFDRSIEFYKENGTMHMISYTNGVPTNSYTRYMPKQHSIAELAAFNGNYYSEIVGTIYKFEVHGDYLTATNLRTEDIILDPLTEDRFASEDAWFFSEIRFERNDKGQITGFYLNTPEIKQLWFKKLKQK